MLSEAVSEAFCSWFIYLIVSEEESHANQEVQPSPESKVVLLYQLFFWHIVNSESFFRDGVKNSTLHGICN